MLTWSDIYYLSLHVGKKYIFFKGGILLISSRVYIKVIYVGKKDITPRGKNVNIRV